MKKMKKWFINALPTLILLTIWLISMWYATVAGAQQLYEDWEKQSDAFTTVSNYGETERLVYRNEAPMEYLELPLFGGELSLFSDDDGDVGNHVQVACYYLDENNKATPAEGNYAVIQYSRSLSDDVSMGHCYIDMDATPAEWKSWLKETLEMEYTRDGAPFVALSGSFEGERFVPLKAQWIDGGNLEDLTLGSIRDWTVIFDHTDGTTPPETIWVRAYEALGVLHSDGGINLISTKTDPITFGETKYDNLQALAEVWENSWEYYVGYNNKYGEYYDTGYSPSLAELCEAVFIRKTSQLEEYINATPEDVNFTSCVQIIRCYPLRSAMLQLLPVYLVSLLLVLGSSIAVGKVLRRRYNKSIRNALRRGQGEDTDLPVGQHGWKDLATLESLYAQTADVLRRQTPELRRLEKALSYAGDAEESRRKMVSDMTHELKTPLAVIHSYAEGLNDDIAPDKREKYLSIIMEEAEKMDTMVLSMLDLSRLEAGKVKLSHERICLMDMTKKTFEKLEPLYQEKKLTIHYFGQSFDTYADEGRMDQVITNLVTNAIKYCTSGGHISVTVKRQGEKTLFAIENDCDNLSEKALNQIWDSFFREDASRSTKGTGLGLPIVKAIIELHGGTCTAVNTYSGVEFNFILP